MRLLAERLKYGLSLMKKNRENVASNPRKERAL
jgi:hypothetical protein